MTHNRIITLHALVYAVFAIVLFVLPDTVWPLYGMEINDRYARFLSQHTSIFLGGVAALAWLLRSEDGETARKVVLGLLITNGLGVAITLYAALIGTFSGFGWSDPAFFALMFLLCLLALRKV